MLTLNHDRLKFIYNNIISSINLCAPFYYLEGDVKELKFEILKEEGFYKTIITYNSDCTSALHTTPTSNLDEHFREIKEILDNAAFCSNCDSIVKTNCLYDDLCLKCTFVKSFTQTHINTKCSICMEMIENDILKVTCCSNFFHKTCRFKYGKWEKCPLCRSEDLSY